MTREKAEVLDSLRWVRLSTLIIPWFYAVSEMI